MSIVTTVLLINFIYIFITSILYFSKKKVMDKENIYLSVLLVLTLICIGFEYFNYISITKSVISDFGRIVHNTYESFLVIWSTVFFLYCLGLVEQNDKKETLKSIITKLLIAFVFILIVASILALLPSNIVNGKIMPYEAGPKAILILFIIGFYILVIDINMFLNKKNELRKIIPLISFEVIFVIGIILRTFIISPEYIITSQIISLIVITLVVTVNFSFASSNSPVKLEEKNKQNETAQNAINNNPQPGTNTVPESKEPPKDNTDNKKAPEKKEENPEETVEVKPEELTDINKIE